MHPLRPEESAQHEQEQAQRQQQQGQQQQMDESEEEDEDSLSHYGAYFCGCHRIIGAGLDCFA